MFNRRELGLARLLAQGLLEPTGDAVAAVSRSVAMQGQDLAGVLASAALRSSSGQVKDVIAALDAGLLVRGYPMRGTVFLLTAADAAWVTSLCVGPALRAQTARRSALELDQPQVDLAVAIAMEALAVDNLSRASLFERWEEGGLSCAGGRGYHLLSHLIMHGLVCFGPWNGTDQDVVLAQRWLPADGTLEARFAGERIPAVAELLLRYLTGHGPATVRDFAWWTKLPLREIRAALPLVADRLETDGAPEPSYWRPGLRDEVAALGRAAPTLLLPGFDEYILGYQDRLFAMTPEQHDLLVPGNNGVFRRTVLQAGQAVGVWRRGGRPGRRGLEVEPFAPLSARVSAAAERRFAAFPFVGD